MTWIKRNLWFLISLLIAVGCMGAGGYYFYTQYQAEGDLTVKIAEQYDLLKQLTTKKPNPGKAGTGNVDNVAAAQEQTQAAQALVAKLRVGFQPVRPVETTANFQHQIDGSVGEMKAAAQQAGVTLPTDYHFTFQAESKMVNLPAKTFPELAGHLSQIQAICSILFQAKINSLENLQRPVVAEIETNGPDYLPGSAMPAANPLANMTPYKVTFHCFSGELGAVLAGLASSPHGFIVKYVDVDPGSGVHLPATLPQVDPKLRRPVPFLNENLLGITLLIEVVQPKTAK